MVEAIRIHIPILSWFFLNLQQVKCSFVCGTASGSNISWWNGLLLLWQHSNLPVWIWTECGQCRRWFGVRRVQDVTRMTTTVFLIILFTCCQLFGTAPTSSGIIILLLLKYIGAERTAVWISICKTGGKRLLKWWRPTATKSCRTSQLTFQYSIADSTSCNGALGSLCCRDTIYLIFSLHF